MPDYSTISSLGHIPTLSWRDTPKISHKLIRWLIGLKTFVGKTITEKLPHGVQNSYDHDHTLLEKANNNGEKKRIVYDFLRGHTHTHQFWNLKDTPNGFVLYCLTYLLLFLSGACGSLYMTHVVNKLQPSKHPFKQVQPGTLPALHSFWGPLFHSKKWI